MFLFCFSYVFFYRFRGLFFIFSKGFRGGLFFFVVFCVKLVFKIWDILVEYGGVLDFRGIVGNDLGLFGGEGVV